jgi:hypothetical protein
MHVIVARGLAALCLAGLLLSGPAFAASTVWNSGDKAAAVTLPTFTGSASSPIYAETTANNSAYANVRGTNGQSSGVHYFEIFVAACNAFSATWFGVADATQSLTAQVGLTIHGAAYACNNNVMFNNTTLHTGTGAGPLGKIIGIVLDQTNAEIWFTTDYGATWNFSASNNPCTNVGGYSISGIGGTLYPVYSGDSNDGVPDIGGAILNTGGAGTFAIGTIPSCASAWDAATATIPANGSTAGQLVAKANGAYSSYSGSHGNITLTNGNLTATATTSGTDNNQPTVSNAGSAKYTGSWYFEVTINNASSNCGGCSLNVGLLGLFGNEKAMPFNGQRLGSDVAGVSLGAATGGWVYQTATSSTGCTLALNTVIGFAVKMTATTLKAWCTTDGAAWKPSGSPAGAGSGGFSANTMASYGVVPAATVPFNATNFDQVTFNYGASALTYTLPAGVCAWNNTACGLAGAAGFVNGLW